MRVYREEPKEPPVPKTVEVEWERFAHLERCEKLLDTLNLHGVHVYVDPSSRRRRDKWQVAIETGEHVDVYPVWLEGEGNSLTEAVEDALDLPPVEAVWKTPEEPDESSRAAALVGFIAGALFFMVMSAVLG